MAGEVKVFRIRGCMKYRDGRLQPFEVEAVGLSKEQAVEEIYSVLGSRHKLRRSQIRIHAVEEISPSEAKSDYIKHLASLQMIVVP